MKKEVLSLRSSMGKRFKTSGSGRLWERHSRIITIALWRDWITNEVLKEYNLNNRQRRAIDYLKSNREITNRDYKELTGCTGRTALRDIQDLMAFGLVDKVGTTGRNTYYRLRKKPDINPTNPT